MGVRQTGFTLLTFAVLMLEMASAQTPRVVRYSGVVRDAAGAPQTGLATLTFAIYAEENDAAPMWTETQVVAIDAQGRYAVHLGATAAEGLPTELFAEGEARWLGITVEGDAESARVALVSVPYALKAADADTVGGKPLSAFVLAGDKTEVGADGLTYVDKQAIGAGTVPIAPAATLGTPGYLALFTGATDLGNSVMFQSGTSVGLGTTTPAATFNVTSPSTPGVFFDVISNNLGALPAVYRAARGTPGAPMPVQANDILGGLAVRGYRPSGFSEGKGQVMFRAAENWTDTANGTYLQFTTTPTGASVFAERMRIDPAGNVGIGTTTPSPYRLAVVGPVLVDAATADVGFEVDSTGLAGVAVTNQNAAGDGVGVLSYAGGIDAAAVLGYSEAGAGVFGATDAGFGVFGISTTVDGWAGYFEGDVGVSGFLYKGGGAFKIDHPLDPENKYLSHSFVESPDMKNIYDGVAVLDGSGEAIVTLPDWFEALNEDFRYQLTPMGAPFVPYIAEEIAGNRFKIAGGVPGKKVSWQVTGIRHDAFAKANRLQVEELKPEAAVGTYLHPAAFGQSVETDIAAGTAEDQKGKDQKSRDQKLKEQRARLRAISQKPSIR